MDKTKIDMKVPAQFKKNEEMFFEKCIVKIEGISEEQFREAAEKLKYFEIDGKMCRCLPFDKEILG